jgi:hypothetical protein
LDLDFCPAELDIEFFAKAIEVAGPDNGVDAMMDGIGEQLLLGFGGVFCEVGITVDALEGVAAGSRA